MQFEMKLPGQTRHKALIGLTPLIDVVFILLLFFLLASSFLEWHTISLTTPVTQGMVKGSSGGAVLIRLNADGVVDLNGRPVEINELPTQLKTFLSDKPAQKILVRPAGGVPLQAVVHILDTVKKAGGTNVSLTR